jgi:hypothetical protein
MTEKPEPKRKEVEELPDAWERFERAFDTVMKAPRKPAPATKAREPSPKRDGRRVGKGPA